MTARDRMNDGMGLSDTHPRMLRFQLEGYRRMTPEEKLDRVRQLNLGVQQLALARIQTVHPAAGERELRLRLASLWLDRDTMLRVFDWDLRARGW